MDLNSFPTKGNLRNAKNSLALATQGYGLMDKKRNILVRELVNLTDQAASLQEEISSTFSQAYAALQRANIEMGISHVWDIAQAVPEVDDIQIKVRSVMGAEIPLIEHDAPPSAPTYAFYGTTEALDEAKRCFDAVRELSIRLAMIDTAAYRLSLSIKKTQKRANALKNITIPHYETLVKSITEQLEEKEREEFSRLKVIKRIREEKKTS